MKIATPGLDLIKSFEGLHLEAYPDPIGIPTIGYGHTKGVVLGQKITAAQAEDFLRQDLAWAEDAVNEYVTAPINQNQFDALVSFVFNLGPANLKRSDLLKYTNLKQCERAAQEFGRWVYAGGRKFNGLVRRREAERQLYLTPVVTPSGDAEKYRQAIAEEIKINSMRWDKLEDEQRLLHDRNKYLRGILG